MSFPRYPNYKDSGVEWLGEVPGHWEVTRLRYVTNIRKGKLPRETYPTQSASSDLPYLSMEFLRGDTETPHYVPESPSLLCAEDDDVLLLWDGSNAGEFLRAKRGVVSSTVAHLSGINIDRDFLFYACKAIQRGLQDQTIGMGIPHVSGDELRTRAIACPQIAEQTQIAAFLDRETAKIDELVAEQRRLMELLKEKRQAVISHAVTQGLNPHAPMKPSGIEWLGDVPEHWELKATKRLFRLVAEPAPDDNDHELLSIYTAIGVRPRKELEAKGNKATTTDGYWLVQKGDLIVNKLLAWMGAIGISEYDGVTSPAYDILRQRIPLDPRFYDYLFRCGICFSEFRRWSRGIMDMRLRLYFDELGQLVMPYPPESEQREIVAFLQVELERFDTLTAEAQRAIDLLQERRTALISAAVTGQIDIRTPT